MSWFSELRDGVRLRRNVHDLEWKNRILHASLQGAFDLLTGTGDSTATRHYTGNPYPTYSSKVVSLKQKYDGVAEWGCGICRAIVDVRAAFILGGGVVPFIRPGVGSAIGSRELDYIKEFLSSNSLDRSISNSWVRSGEIEGKVLIHMARKGDSIHVIHIPWSDRTYSIRVDEGNADYNHYVTATYDGTLPFSFPEPEFLYVRFGGIGNNVNEPVSKSAHALRQMESLDKNAWDWRQWNHLFASPTPDFQVETSREASDIWAAVKEKNWRLGKLIVHTGKFSLIQAQGDGYATLREEAESLAKQLSGITGVPPQLFGYSDLVANRSTGDALMEGIVLATNDERAIWENGFRDLFRKTLEMANSAPTNGKAFDPTIINARIPFVSAAKLKELTEIWLPLYIAHAVDLSTILSKIPEIDIEEVGRLVKAEADERFAKEVEQLKANRGANDGTDNATGAGGVDNRVSGPVSSQQRSDRTAAQGAQGRNPQ